MATPSMRFEPNQLGSAIVYLRLWKLCDALLSRATKNACTRWFEVMPLTMSDEANMLDELRRLAGSNLEWAEAPNQMRYDINAVLEFSAKATCNEEDLSKIKGLQENCRLNALRYSGKVTIAPSVGIAQAAAAAR